MYCVGLTGNIASGKSTVCRFFKARGVTIINADEIAREITGKDKPALLAIKEHFGPVVITNEGELNRMALREIIFNNPEQRLWLEQLLHPIIRQLIETKISKACGPYCIIEIPLLKKRTDYPYLDRILLIVANKEHQINRVIIRDKTHRGHAEAILNTQLDNTIREAFADDIVDNNSSLAELEEKIANLHKLYLQFAESR